MFFPFSTNIYHIRTDTKNLRHFQNHLGGQIYKSHENLFLKYPETLLFLHLKNHYSARYNQEGYKLHQGRLKYFNCHYVWN